ncbi:hypothetical protein V6M85_05325 [Sulfolobus tengchongensis]|uniref:Uncharacterized protein n=1 Tax=Sulfolobus tengchongensis TaxID=207809 RepID=A0AAX4L4B6_9CREN
MFDQTQLSLAILVIPLPILTYLWFKYYNLIISEGTKYVGEKYTEEEILLLPSTSKTVRVNGKVVILVYGVNSWVTIRVNGGPKQKIFKIRLLNEIGDLELINESKVFQVKVKLRYSA